MALLISGPVMDFKQVNNDLYINPITGDFEMVPSDNQHILDILGSFPGWWKNSPLTGAGFPILLKGKITPDVVESRAKSQLEADGYQTIKPKVTITPNGEANISINAVRI